MTKAEARTAVRASTLHDADTQVTDAQIDAQLEVEYAALLRLIGQVAPSLYENVTTPVIASGQSTINKPAAFERLVLLERLWGTEYVPVMVTDRESVPRAGGSHDLYVLEQPTTLAIIPAEHAPGSYRLTVLLGPAPGWTTIDVPAGLEQIVVQRVAAWVRQRHGEDPSYHQRVADDLWRSQRPLLKRRYGAHHVSGLKRVRYW